MSVVSVFSPHHKKHVKLGRDRSLPKPIPVRAGLDLEKYIIDSDASPLPTPPNTIDWSVLPPGTPQDVVDAFNAAFADIDGNDDLGDCVIAWLAHYRAVSSAQGGRPVVHFPLSAIVQMYGGIGGYVQGDPSTDQGCDEQTAVNYVAQTGWPDGMKVVANVLVNAKNPTLVNLAIWLFLGVGTGAGMPQAWISPFPSGPGYTWDVAGPSVPRNGHCTYWFGYDATKKIYTTNSWGMKGATTQAAGAKYMSSDNQGEVHGILTPEIIIQAKQLAPNGIAWADIESDIAKYNQESGT